MFENQTLEDIKEVHSHPMALLQCKEFFNDYDILVWLKQLIQQSSSTNFKRKLKGIAAIGSKEAAKT